MDDKETMVKATALISLTKEIISLLQKIDGQNELNRRANSENGKMEFAYVQYYLTEAVSLLELSIFLLQHDKFQKYTYFPGRLLMEIVLQLEHVYSVKKKKGQNAVRRLFFKDIAISAKSTLALPGEAGKEKIESHLRLLDIASKLLRLDFRTNDVSAKSSRDIKSLCQKSHIIIKNSTGIELYSFYEVLSESFHANVVSIGAGNFQKDIIGALAIFEISIELAIRFAEMIVTESNYAQFRTHIMQIKQTAGLKI